MKKSMMRYSWLEYLAYWEGRLSASKLGRILGQSREHVQRDVISAYRHEFPGVLAGGPGRSQSIDRHEDLHFAPSGAHRLVDLLRGEATLSEALGEPARFGIPVEDVGTIAFRETEPEIFRSLYRGCVQRRCVLVEYLSKNRVAVMRFSPHALVRDVARLHFRGYASWTQDHRGYYIDLVPSRVRRIYDDVDRWNYVPDTDDREWHERVNLTFRLNPDLPKNIRQILILEYEGEKAREDFTQLVIPDVRLAMTRYVERTMKYRFFGEEMHHVWMLGERKKS
ncbi:hypothetical protein [Ectothiorhodospira lacustris]|uniref:hypothetical protein n=1 Tax=Ectothiorhodospira lacustris TaxID=2899127 RepID=UPI001EE9071E|nr:hypothetical protein [Ectothiorhodospira lacustris]MCG5508766.1 hypothetical protein [Ectothiorhodospira lacustris]MCG5520557.1 hypothetical protein [Ectothiorhodospira lacustris]